MVAINDDDLVQFETIFGAGEAPVIGAWAPGRVNLIGEHTDYQGGYVLPLALRRGTRVDLRPRPDSTVCVFSDAGTGVPSYQLGAEQRCGDWADYVRGVTAALCTAGYAIGGFDARITSDLPVGRGLSSSAALTVAVVRALRRAFGLVVDDVTLAQLARRAETDFVGVPVGIMDQMACSLGDPGSALFLDTRSLVWRRVSLPPSLQALVVDPGIPHRNADSGYRQRRREAEEAARRLGVAELRDLSEDDLPRIQRLPGVLAQRARHIVTENARVLAFCAALERGARDRLRALLAASHRSLRDDYEVSIPDIDALVEICDATPGVVGARLTGGGFGGSVIALVEARQAGDAARSIVASYAQRAGREAVTIMNDPPAVAPQRG